VRVTPWIKFDVRNVFNSNTLIVSNTGRTRQHGLRQAPAREDWRDQLRATSRVSAVRTHSFPSESRSPSMFSGGFGRPLFFCHIVI